MCALLRCCLQHGSFFVLFDSLSGRCTASFTYNKPRDWSDDIVGFCISWSFYFFLPKTKKGAWGMFNILVSLWCSSVGSHNHSATIISVVLWGRTRAGSFLVLDHSKIQQSIHEAAFFCLSVKFWWKTNVITFIFLSQKKNLKILWLLWRVSFPPTLC